MTEDEEEYLYKLQGRVLACEELQRRLINMVALLIGPSDPLKVIGQMEKATMAGLQNIERDIGDEADLIWSTMADHIRDRFGTAKAAVEGH